MEIIIRDNTKVIFAFLYRNVNTYGVEGLLVNPDHLMSYRSNIEIGLPAPYKTNCFDYNQLNLDGQDDAVSECLIRNSNGPAIKWSFAPINDKTSFKSMKVNLSECLSYNSKKNCFKEIFEQNIVNYDLIMN